MEISTTAWATVAVVIVTFGAIVIYSIEREVIKSDLLKAKNEFSSEQSVLETRQKTLTERKASFASAQARATFIRESEFKLQQQEEQNAKALIEVTVLRDAWTKTRAAFAKDIEEVRQKTMDQVIPELVLNDGKRLKSARFKEMKEQIAILEHAEGIARIPADNMPPDWFGRLALGWNPKLSSDLSGKPDEEVVAVPETPVKTIEQAQEEHRDSVKREDVNDAVARIKVLERKIIEAERSRANQFKIQQEYAYKHQLALAKGNSSSHNVKRDAAGAAVEAISNQINAAREQIQKLNEEIQTKQGAFR